MQNEPSGHGSELTVAPLAVQMWLVSMENRALSHKRESRLIHTDSDLSGLGLFDSNQAAQTRPLSAVPCDRAQMSPHPQRDGSPSPSPAFGQTAHHGCHPPHCAAVSHDGRLQSQYAVHSRCCPHSPRPRGPREARTRWWKARPFGRGVGNSRPYFLTWSGSEKILLIAG
jgi:hypothetical protein